MVTPTTYLREVIQEIKKVTWPSREQTQNMTILVIIASLIVGLYIGLLDYIFQQIITAIL
jgi:preprotein translocase subunit SecE